MSNIELEFWLLKGLEGLGCFKQTINHGVKSAETAIAVCYIWNGSTCFGRL